MAYIQQSPPEMGPVNSGLSGPIEVWPFPGTSLPPPNPPRCAFAFAECITWLFAHEILHAEGLVHAWYPSELTGAILDLYQRAEESWCEQGEARARLRNDGFVYIPAAGLPHQPQAVADLLPQSDRELGNWQQAKRRRFEVAPSGRGDEDRELLRSQSLAKALWAILGQFPNASAKTYNIAACWPSPRKDFVAIGQSRLTIISVSVLSGALNA